VDEVIGTHRHRVRACLNGWLAAGAPHHEVMNLGHPADWKVFCQLAGIEFVQV